MFRPQLAVGRQPVIELGQRLRPDAVEPALGVGAGLHQSRLLEHAQVLRHRGLAQTKVVDQLPDRSFSVSEQVQDGLPAGLAQDLEGGEGRHRPSIPLWLYICQGN